jgi:hypothetical protein
MNFETDPIGTSETSVPDSNPSYQTEVRTDIEHEAKSKKWDTKIILQRHGRYENGFPENGWANPSDEEKERLGHLTPEGASEAREIAADRVKEALDRAGSDVDFLVVASPTFWLDHPELGQRAIETGEIIADEVTRQLKETGLSELQLLNTTESFHGDKVRQSGKIVESQMFQDLGFTNELREKYGGQNRDFWDAYNADSDRLRRKEVGAEGSPEAADRVNDLLNTLARWARIRNISFPHRKTVIFVVSHHEAIEPYAQRVLGTAPGEFEPQYNDGIEINIDSEGIGRTTLAGKAIEVSFMAHGKAPSVDHE